MPSRPGDRPMPDAPLGRLLTLRPRLAHRWTAFESRHRRLVDDLTAALVTLLAVAAWYAAFALFDQ